MGDLHLQNPGGPQCSQELWIFLQVMQRVRWAYSSGVRFGQQSSCETALTWLWPSRIAQADLPLSSAAFDRCRQLLLFFLVAFVGVRLVWATFCIGPCCLFHERLPLALPFLTA